MKHQGGQGAQGSQEVFTKRATKYKKQNMLKIKGPKGAQGSQQVFAQSAKNCIFHVISIKMPSYHYLSYLRIPVRNSLIN